MLEIWRTAGKDEMLRAIPDVDIERDPESLAYRCKSRHGQRAELHGFREDEEAVAFYSDRIEIKGILAPPDEPDDGPSYGDCGKWVLRNRPPDRPVRVIEQSESADDLEPVAS